MQVSFFSDLHIKFPGDEASNLVENLFNNPYFLKSSHVIFLGDIFDILIGEHDQYFDRYDVFFKGILNLLERGIKVTYLEGNHDFHVKNSMESFFRKNSHHSHLFEYKKEGFYLEISGKNYYVCHGDEVDYTNEAFKRWKNIYTSRPFQILVNNIVPYKMIKLIGDRASQNSKSRGSKTFDYSHAKQKYREGAKQLIQEKNVQGVICGHTHIQENHVYSDGAVYLNSGFPLKDKNFLIVAETSRFESI
ncbi:MAG: hypothetical protein CME62_02830 [Halobacteriovoraceae bacterium]|nr:hypothetical protein [Halobacteriovoraceae bacterium]|tara:strand:- start:17647 stop:18390 length:744 start_codon:yes stop_codon:yes gene_type:complete